MKAFRVHYDTEVYRVFSELILVADETHIPQALAEKSDKGFVIDDPKSVIRGAKEIPLEQLKITDLTVAELLLLIDNRVSNPPETTKQPQATEHISTEVLDVLELPNNQKKLKQLYASYNREYQYKSDILARSTNDEEPIREALIKTDCMQLEIDLRAIEVGLQKNKMKQEGVKYT